MKMPDGLRPYAAHWEWPDKGIKEQGIMRDFIEARLRHGLQPYEMVVPHKPDPPDFVAKEKRSDRLIGIEITELVSEEAILANIVAKTSEENKYRYWTHTDVLEALQKILDEKDAKKYHGGPYDEIHVVIHTDEPGLSPVEYGALLAAHAFKAMKQINRAYLLFSYHPGTKSYPLIELNFE